MAYREVRIREAGNKLAFRYDPEADTIEVKINGQPYPVNLRDYWPITRRLECGTIGVGVNFERIEGAEQ